MGNNVVPIIGFAILLLFGAVFYIVLKIRSNKEAKKSKNKGTVVENTSVVGYKKNQATGVNKEDIFKFMEFDKIQDDMIISQNGEKYTAVLKCKGINYNLMSEMEQLSVEEGFINFLNTLKFPIQLYVQVQNINLKDNVQRYKNNMAELNNEFEDLKNDYNMAVNSLDASEDELFDAEKRKNSVQNVMEYGQDIVRYVEKLSLNKNMLQRNFYVLCSYYKSEIANSQSFKPGEILDICYSELYTRVQNIVSGLSMSTVNAEPLKSNDLAELLYSAYNRDDYNYMSVKDALNSGFHRLYSTSEDAITKKNEMLIDTIRQEAEYKAVQALAKAIEDGNLPTVEDAEETFDEESSREALELIKKEKIDNEIKEKAKKIVVNEYKEAKKKRIANKIQRIEKIIGPEQEEKITSKIDLQEQGVSIPKESKAEEKVETPSEEIIGSTADSENTENSDKG